MDEACLQHRLTEEERRRFDSQGFLIVPGVLPEAKVAALVEAADRIDAEWRPKRDLKPHQPLNVLDAFGMDDEFLDLLDLPATFMRVVDILGWHIQLYHSHLIVTPPLPSGFEPPRPRLGWHQDSGRLNIELEGEPRPRVSLKVGFFLTSTLEPNRGNFHVVPGSHKLNQRTIPTRPRYASMPAMPFSSTGACGTPPASTDPT